MRNPRLLRSLLGSLALLSFHSEVTEGQQPSSEKGLFFLDISYDPAEAEISAADPSVARLYVRALVRYEPTDEQAAEVTTHDDTQVLAQCFLNTEADSAQKPGKNWLDTDVSCFSLDWRQTPDYPEVCVANRVFLHSEGNTVGCHQLGSERLNRCFNSTQPNRYIGWATGGLAPIGQFTNSGQLVIKDVLPSGAISCHRFFRLRGTVEGLEVGDWLKFHADVPDPATGAIVPWEATITPSTGISLPKAPQIADGATYSARIVSGPDKKSCTFKRNGAATIQATFTDVDDRGRTSGGLDLTDLSIACICNDGAESCPPDRVLNVEATGIEEGETATVGVTIQHPAGGQAVSEAFPIPGSGTWTVVSNLPEGASYTVTFNSFTPVGKTCSVGNGSGEVPAAGAVVQLSCSCDNATGSSATGGSSTAAVTSGCPSPPPRGFRDILQDVQIADVCARVSLLCDNDLDPWWSGGGRGPKTGDAPCQRETVCVDGPPNCWTDPETDETHCGDTLQCHDQCVPQSKVALTGPLVALDVDPDKPLSGTLLLSGWASDQEGIQLLRLYLDGEPLALGGFRDDILRPDACGPISGDCAGFGFQGTLDTTAWPDGTHRLLVFAVDGRSDYPMPTAYQVDLTFDNACTSTAPPTGSLLLPADGAVVAGTVLVEAQAAAENGVERVRFYLDGSRVATDWTAPYRWSWATTGVPDGSHVLHAEVLDTCGNVATTASRNVTVANANDPPQLALETPTPLLQLSGVATVSGWAVDADSIESVSLRLGTQVLPLASPVEWVDRADVCSGSAVADPRCPRVGWRTSFDTTLWPDGLYSFQVVAVDGRGGSASRSITLSIRNMPVAPPTVSTPASVTVVEGSDVRFTVSASGEGALSFRWQYRSGSSWISLSDGERGGRVSGAGTHRLRLADAVTADQTSYRCLVANEGGTTASSSASLTVEEVVAPPNVTAGLNQRVTEGTDAHLWVSAQGVGPLAYQWQKWGGSWVDVTDGGTISGSTTSMLTIASARSGDAAPYRCRVSNEGGTTDSDPVQLAVDPLPVGTCQESSTTLCFQADRFAVTATVNGGSASSMPFSQEGGFFWMFEPQTVEVAIKILDGTAANGYFWVFHGSLTDLGYTVTVTDTITGASKTYMKDAGHFCGDADTAAFPDSTSAAAPAGLLVPLAPGSAIGRSSTGCASSSTLACLLGGKFGVEVLRSGTPQPGVAVTDLSASFGFVTATAPEVVVKVIDGTSVNGWYWLFFGSLTHQDFTVRVTDGATGEFRTYVSPGQFCGGADTTAF